MATDPVAEAVAATEPRPLVTVAVQVALSTGRPVGMVVPADLTTREALDLVAFVSGGLGAELERQRQAAAGKTRPLLVPDRRLHRV